jgi:hypothetical protein
LNACARRGRASNIAAEEGVMNVNARLSVAVLLCLLAPLAVLADGVATRSIFPSDRFTVFDSSQNTFRRVNLPVPADCAAPANAARALQCQDISVLNTLDGFNIQPRVSIAFDGPIDVSSVNSDSVFLVNLGWRSFGDRVGINQVVWDPATNTLHFESDELLEQHTTYAVVVTNRVLDAEGKRLKKAHPRLVDDDEQLERATRRHGGQVVAATLFTTQSVSSTLEKVHAQIGAAATGPTNFNLGAGGERTVFSLASLRPSPTNPAPLVFTRQVALPPVTPTVSVSVLSLQLSVLDIRPGVIGTVAFGSYDSPSYHVSPGEFIPPTGTRTGTPVRQSTKTVYFNLFVPAGLPPASGWPVAIFGHGFGDNKNNSPFFVASSMAAQGVATIAINVVGHGGGPAGTLTVNRGPGLPVVTLPAGGRGIDQNGDNRIDGTEGSSAGAPRILIGSSDGLRQTTIDLMQLVRQIQAGMDVDGDGAPDLDAGRIYYFGQSFGGIYGTIFLGVERDVRVGVPNVPGGPIVDIIRLSPVFRPLFVAAITARGLPNIPENLPLRDQPPVVITTPDSLLLQDFTDQSEWASQSGSPVAYAPYIRKSPLGGNPLKSVIYQIAKGDRTVPNPTSTAIIRAGELKEYVTYYRNDLAGSASVANPHTFLTSIAGATAANALAAQAQIARFFATDGSETIDPDGAGDVFETPIEGELPEVLNF